MSISDVPKQVAQYAAGKTWYWYVPLWLFGIYAYIELFMFNMVRGEMPFVWLVPYSFDFFMHEWAHIFTAFLPPVLTASAGSGSELLLGLVLIVMAFWQRSYFASLFCFLWFDLACQSAGQYMADAVPQQLPLVSLGAALSGGDAKHDWNFVFGQLHLLGASAFIGNSVRVIGALAGLFGIVFTAWVLYKIARAPRWATSSNETLLAATTPDPPIRKPEPSDDTGFTSLPISDNPEHDTRDQPRHIL